MPEPSSPRKPTDSSPSKLLRNSPVDMLGGILVNSIISTKLIPDSQTNQSPKNAMREKPALSVPLTTLNFKKFVSKCGPIFAAQEAVEEIIGWQNASKTMACACMWAWLSLNPVYFILLPNLALIWILLATHSQRYPHGMGDDLGADPTSGKHVSDDPVEGSPDYVSNLQNIQNMMGDVTNGIDFVKQNVLIYLDWSHPQVALNILYAAVISTIGLAFVGPLIPWRLVLLIGGEAIFVLNHPWVQARLALLKSVPSSV